MFNSFKKYKFYKVVIALKNKSRMSGVLLDVDEHSNIILDDVEEIKLGQKRLLGLILIRGDNIKTVTAKYKSGYNIKKDEVLEEEINMESISDND